MLHSNNDSTILEQTCVTFWRNIKKRSAEIKEVDMFNGTTTCEYITGDILMAVGHLNMHFFTEIYYQK